MGQNSNKESFDNLHNQNYFLNQIELYKWRADSHINTHICRVSFQLQSSLKNKQQLKSLIDKQYQNYLYVPFKQILQLAKQACQSQDQIMEFEEYICCLLQLEEKLTLEQVLYTLFVMFSGYQIIWSKFGKIPVNLQCCFVTDNGQVRVWHNSDFKSNQMNLGTNSDSDLISSQLHIIKRIIYMGQKLSINHTQYLLFSRQFKQFLERDILRNYNFATCRKYVNNYAYTYKINRSSNLIKAINRLIKQGTTTRKNISVCQSSQVKQVSREQTKHPCRSTGGSVFGQKDNQNILNSFVKGETSRIASSSEYQSQKGHQSNLSYQTSMKYHAKKYSSTDLKHILMSGSKPQSPKMNKSFQFPQNKKLDDIKFKLNQSVNQGSQHKKHLNKKSKLCLSMDLSSKQNSDRKQLNKIPFKRYEEKKITFNCDNIIQTKQVSNKGIIKQSQHMKQKKKLQKKVASIGDNISYHLVQQQSIHNKQQTSVQNFIKFNLTSKQNIACEQSIKKIQLQNDKKQKIHKRLLNKTSINMTQCPHKQRQQNIKSQSFNNRMSSESFQRDDNHYNTCVTKLTINKLIQNSQFSMHESNGSFMSIQKSNDSQYKGVLCGMGRSIDIQNMSSNKQLQDQKINKLNNKLNKSINY